MPIYLSAVFNNCKGICKGCCIENNLNVAEYTLRVKRKHIRIVVPQNPIY